ncbi:MAG TPA: DUF6178 family protein [Planctomycetota bacterium]|nr:DUF6178 family protein [Planctomycetota bacterium]
MLNQDESADDRPDVNPDPQHAIELAKKADELLALAQTDRRAAELAFEKLGFDAQLETALALQGDTLHEWLMLSEDLTELVRALPPEHLHTAIRLIGEEDALNLLQAASSEQMQQMTDIEFFTEGKLDHKKVRRWIELLMELDEDECDVALQGLDVNALAQYLRRKVRPAIDKDNLLLALHLNQRYLFTPDDLTTNDDLARRFLDFLYNVDRDLFGEVLALLVAEDKEVVENDMYAGREDRLIKRGFPAVAKAEHLLELVNASAYGIEWPKPAETSPVQMREPATTLATKPAAANTPFLLHALAWGRASGALGERTERQFIKESADLANSLLLAHTKDMGNPERRPEALLAVQVLASIALEALSMSSVAAGASSVSMKLAVERLKSMELRELFQLGWSLTREVAKDAWILAMDDRISDAGLERNLKWLPDDLRNDVLEAEDYMSWRRIAASAAAGTDQKLLTWPRLVELRWAVDRARNALVTQTEN